MNLFLEILIIFLASVNLLLTRFVLVRLKQPTTVPLWLIKVFASALSPILLSFGLFVAVAGLIFSSIVVLVIGTGSVLLYSFHIIQTTRAPDASTNLESGFSKKRENRITPGRKSLFLRKRYVFGLPKSSEPIFEQNIPFY